jgi:hypothetical protein
LGHFNRTGVAEPTLAQDAATKKYVDTALNSSNDLQSQMYFGNISGKAEAVPLSELLQ